MRTPANDALLQVQDLRTYFPIRASLFAPRRTLKAVDGVSLELPRGQTLGLVGESGCGKSTLARTILRLVPATSGRVWFDGLDVLALPPRDLRRLRQRMQIVFQDPIGSLNPRLRVETIVGEALLVHKLVPSRHAMRQRVAELLTLVGLAPADAARRPHEFSGGQRQRIGIARALALRPQLIVADEPVSALDVSIQAQILNLLADLQAQLGLSCLFVAHNLGVVQHFCDHVAVMYLGRIVEQGPAAALYAAPHHPYTQTLLAAAPRIETALNRPPLGNTAPLQSTNAPAAPPLGISQKTSALDPKASVLDEPPSPFDPPTGCAFHPRCPWAIDRCRAEIPQLRAIPSTPPAQRVACHRAEEIAPT